MEIVRGMFLQGVGIRRAVAADGGAGGFRSGGAGAGGGAVPEDAGLRAHHRACYTTRKSRGSSRCVCASGLKLSAANRTLTHRTLAAAPRYTSGPCSSPPRPVDANAACIYPGGCPGGLRPGVIRPVRTRSHTARQTDQCSDTANSERSVSPNGAAWYRAPDVEQPVAAKLSARFCHR